MTPQQLQQVRDLLTSMGAPLTAENYNRASLALVTGRGFTPDMTQDGAPRSVQSRTRSQGNRTAAAAPSQQELPMPPPATPMDDSGPRARMTDGFMKGSNEEANPIMNNIMAQIEAGGMGSNMSPRDAVPIESANAITAQRDAELANMPEGADLSAAFPGGGMGGENVTAGQAVGTMLGDNMIPMALTAMAPGMGAALRAIPQMRITLNRPQLAGPGAGGSPQLPGTAGMPPVGGPSMPPGMSGPGAQARLSAPQALIERARRRVSETARRSRRDGMRND